LNLLDHITSITFATTSAGEEHQRASFKFMSIITKPLLSRGVNGLRELTELHILKAQLQSKHPKISAKLKVPLNRLAALVNFSPITGLTATVSQKISLRNENTEHNILSASRKINN